MSSQKLQRIIQARNPIVYFISRERNVWGIFCGKLFSDKIFCLMVKMATMLFTADIFKKLHRCFFEEVV
jgi:hypothetical protein